MAEFKKGTLRVNLTNESSAYPTVPGTGQQITGQTRYQWFLIRPDGSRAGFPNVTGPALGDRELNGDVYECDVSYEATNVPQGVRISNNPAKTTLSITANEDQVTECPNGTYVPVGQECPKDDVCDTPTYVGGSTSPSGQLAAANGSTQSLSFSLQYRGFLNKDITFVSAGALIWGGQTADETSAPQSYTTDIGFISTLINPSVISGGISGDVCTISGSFTAPFDGQNNDITKSYFVEINAVFTCGGSTFTLTAVIGNTSIKWGNPQGSATAPICRYSGFYRNDIGCGSYISEVTDPQTGQVTYYAVGVRDSVDPKDRVGEWTTAAPIFNCDICPSLECPTASITRVYISPASPTVDDSITAFVEYTVDKNGFETINDTSALRISGTAVPCTPLPGGGQLCNQFSTNGVFQLGKMSAAGTYTLIGEYANTYKDPDRICNNGNLGNLGASKTITFTVTDGSSGLPDDPILDPIISAGISGPQSITLDADGQATATFEASSAVVPYGWIEADRARRYKFEGMDVNSTSTTFTRTFTQPGAYTMSVIASQFFCSPSITGECTVNNTVSGPYEPPNGRKWATDTATININVLEPSTSPGPGPEPAPDDCTGINIYLGGNPCCDPNNGAYTLENCQVIRLELQNEGKGCCTGLGPQPGPSPAPGPTPAPDPSPDTLTGQEPTVSGISVDFTPICDDGNKVTVTAEFDIFMGSGDYESVNATTTSGNWTRSGNTFRQVVKRPAGDHTFGTCVEFTGSNAGLIKKCTGQTAYTVLACGPGPVDCTPSTPGEIGYSACCDPNSNLYNVCNQTICCSRIRAGLEIAGKPCC